MWFFLLLQIVHFAAVTSLLGLWRQEDQETRDASLVWAIELTMTCFVYCVCFVSFCDTQQRTVGNGWRLQVSTLELLLTMNHEEHAGTCVVERVARLDMVVMITLKHLQLQYFMAMELSQYMCALGGKIHFSVCPCTWLFCKAELTYFPLHWGYFHQICLAWKMQR